MFRTVPLHTALTRHSIVHRVVVIITINETNCDSNKVRKTCKHRSKADNIYLITHAMLSPKSIFYVLICYFPHEAMRLITAPINTECILI